MKLIAAGIIWIALGVTLQAQNTAKPVKATKLAPPVKPVVQEVQKPVPPVRPVVMEAPAQTIYVEPKPMAEGDSKVRFGKIYDFINDPAVTPTGDDHPLSYEFKYFNHGAITKEQLKQRRGHYFIVNWDNKGEAEDLVLRFDYRQERSREKINTLEIKYPGTKGHQRGMFSVRGEAYEKLGKVNSWRMTIIRNGQIVAEKKSFIW